MHFRKNVDSLMLEKFVNQFLSESDIDYPYKNKEIKEAIKKIINYFEKNEIINQIIDFDVLHRKRIIETLQGYHDDLLKDVLKKKNR